MITCKCIQKFRDKRGNIYGYRLKDFNGNIQDVTPDNLKCAISKGHICVTNLKLTSNNKLVGANDIQEKYNSYAALTSEKSISNLLGNTPNKPSYSTMNNNNNKQAYLENRAKEIIDKTNISNILDEYYGLYTYIKTMKASIHTRYNYYDIEIILNFRKKTVEIIVTEESLDIDEDDCIDSEVGRITCNDMHICSINKACDIIEDGVHTLWWSVDITNGKIV